jgi:peroxiredoxin/uncharacterized membrane protein YphA (DoxX/SURF4 family)
VNLALLLVRLLLAATFGVAGVAKLADRSGTRAAVAAFGLPERLAGVGAVVLPLGELAVATALIPLGSAWWGAVGAAVLLAGFCAAIAANLAQGRQPDCHCFGQVHSSPVGWTTLVRNGMLLVAAMFVIFEGSHHGGASVVPGHVTAVEGVGLVLGSAVLAEGWLLLALFGRYGRVLRRLDDLEAGPTHPLSPSAGAAGLAVGTRAPEFRLPGLHGETLTLAALRASARPVLLIFTDPACGPCTTLMPDVGRWQADYAGRLTIALVSRQSVEDNLAKTAEHGISNVVLQHDSEVAEAYRFLETPSAVVVGSDGLVESQLVAGPEPIRALVARTVDAELVPSYAPSAAGSPDAPSRGSDHQAGGGHSHPVALVPAPAVMGHPAPAVELPDLDGNVVRLAEFRGRRTIVVFWHPGCGFCERILEPIKAWEAAPSDAAPKLLLISSGGVEANRAQGLRAAILLEESFQVGRLFGASGTPSAVVVDEKGRVASELAVGGPAVLALAGIPAPDPDQPS